MIPKTDFFDHIEDYCLEQLDEDFKLEFEAELLKNDLLRSELELWTEIQSALEEKEVLSLRNKLENVAKQNKPAISSNETFGLFNEFSDIQEISEIFSSEELINFYDSLPKVHAYHHESTSNENIHQFYKEQKISAASEIEEDYNDFDLESFAGLEEAILEKDILQFRQTLKQVAKSVDPQFNVEEIDNYINGELSGSELFNFESDIIQNCSLRDEVKLHREFEQSIRETDVMDLRNQISNILRTESSWNVSEKSIEDFIDGELEGELLEDFNFELQDNTDLIAEVKLRKHINDSLREKDILELRKELFAAKQSTEVKKLKMIIPETNSGQLKFWRSSVAVIIVLLGLTGVLRNSFVSDDTIENYFEAPAWSPERSVTSDVSVMQKANILYLNEEYDQVLEILEQTPTTDNSAVFNFYRAASYQNMNKLNEAISGYTKVIDDSDNMFVEEAEWYRSLCYFKLDDYEQAKMELLAVIQRKGHYEKDAKAILRHLKYSFK